MLIVSRHSSFLFSFYGAFFASFFSLSGAKFSGVSWCGFFLSPTAEFASASLGILFSRRIIWLSILEILADLRLRRANCIHVDKRRTGYAGRAKRFSIQRSHVAQHFNSDSSLLYPTSLVLIFRDLVSSCKEEGEKKALADDARGARRHPAVLLTFLAYSSLVE